MDAQILYNPTFADRESKGPIRVDVGLANFKASGQAELRRLRAEVPWATNSLEKPEAVKPVDSKVDIGSGRFKLELQPYSVVRLRIPKQTR